jgi:hypothetical protein
MTITRISPGVWELRTRHGTLIATGDLYTIVTLWARLRRHARLRSPTGSSRRSTAARASSAPATTTANAAHAPAPPAARKPVAATAARVLRTQAIAHAGRGMGSPQPHRTGRPAIKPMRTPPPRAGRSTTRSRSGRR